MRSYFIDFIKIFLTSFAINVVHLSISMLLPHPVSSINTVFIGFVFILLFWEPSVVVWVALITSYLIELYSTTPFGIVLFSVTAAAVCMLWVYNYVFTNKTYFTAGALIFSSLIIYRFIFVLLIFILETIGSDIILISALIKNFLLEILISTILCTIMFLFLQIFLGDLGGTKTQNRWFRKIS